MRGVNDHEAPGLLRFCLDRGYQLRFIELTETVGYAAEGPSSAALGDLDGDVSGFDGGDREHSWLQAEFVRGLAAEQ